MRSATRGARRRLPTAAAAAALAAAALAAPPPARAQDAASSIGAVVLDMDTVIRNSTAVRSLEEALQARQEEAFERFGERERALVEENRALQRAQQEGEAELDEEALAAREEEIGERVDALARDAEERRSALDRGFRDGLQEVRDRALEISSEIAEGRGADIVLSKETLFLLTEDLEITSEVLERINLEFTRTEAQDEVEALQAP